MGKALSELAKLINGNLKGDPHIVITGAADIEDAQVGDIIFAESARLLKEAEQSDASAIITLKGSPNSGKPMIMVDNPRYAFAQALKIFAPAKERFQGVHHTAFVGRDTVLGDNPSVGFSAHIGQNVTIGSNVWIYPHVYIGDNIRLGDDVVVHPFAAIYDGVDIGDRVIIHSGTCIGSDGFGYTRVGDKHCKIPQIGQVVIGDDVEIGANVTIDRARTGKTEIGKGTKIDNLVHIAHNVKIGENCIIIAQVGVSGSVRIGDRVILAGQAGLNDHLSIADDAIICARAGVVGDVDSGTCVSGYPARPHKEQMRMHAVQQRLPAMLKTLRDLERRVKELEDELKK